MWLLNYVTKNAIPDVSTELGNVKHASKGKLQISASSEFSAIPIVAPYGIASVPPVGEESVVITAGNENVSIGTLSKAEELSPGELMLKSAGGATIALKNDGFVYINGRRIE